MASMESCPHCGGVIDSLDKTCPHCQRGLTGKAMLSQTYVTETRARSRTVAKIFWVVSILCTMVGVVIGIGGVAAASGAPQEAAAAAIGCLIVVAPYVFARGVDELIR
jgi:hypothetical protein